MTLIIIIIIIEDSSNREKRAESMAERGMPNLMDVAHGLPTLVQIPSLQGVYYSSYTPSTHHPPSQPVLHPLTFN